MCGISVSIHATLAGGDGSTPALARCLACFYPRHPRGWRPDHKSYLFALFEFLSTPPSRVATAIITSGRLSAMFLSTPPSRVATASASAVVFAGVFLSTPPSRVATRLCFTEICRTKSFYPRHPRGWRLCQILDKVFINYLFLSTPPSRVATGRNATFIDGLNRFYPRHPRGWRHSA